MARPSCWSPTTHKLLSGRGAQSACVMAASRRPKQDGWKYPHEPRDGCDRTLRAGLCRARGRCHSPATFGPAGRARGGPQAWAVSCGRAGPDGRNGDHLLEPGSGRFLRRVPHAVGEVGLGDDCAVEQVRGWLLLGDALEGRIGDCFRISIGLSQVMELRVAGIAQTQGPGAYTLRPAVFSPLASLGPLIGDR